MSSRIGADRRPRGPRRALRGRVVVLAALLVPCAARAQPSSTTQSAARSPDAALAQSLFDEARQLMLSGRFSEACPKLAESQRLDPALGTLLNLAVCNERAGNTASAWAEYRDAQSIAKREGRSEREAYARDHAAALEPRLSRLVLARAKGNVDRGLDVRLDGATVGEAAFGSAVPIDPGAHRVEVRAVGKKPWTATVTIDDHADKRALEIPSLEDAPMPPAPATVVPGMAEGGPLAITLPSAPLPEPEALSRDETKRTASYVVGGVGLAALVVGSVAGMQAIVHWNDRKRLCQGDACPQAGLDADAAARHWALGSDVGLGVGAAALAVGAYLFFSSGADRAAPRAGSPSSSGRVQLGRVNIVPVASASGGGVGIDGVW